MQLIDKQEGNAKKETKWENRLKCPWNFYLKKWILKSWRTDQYLGCEKISYTLEN